LYKPIVVEQNIPLKNQQSNLH